MQVSSVANSAAPATVSATAGTSAVPSAGASTPAPRAAPAAPVGVAPPDGHAPASAGHGADGQAVPGSPASARHDTRTAADTGRRSRSRASEVTLRQMQKGLSALEEQLKQAQRELAAAQSRSTATPSELQKLQTRVSHTDAAIETATVELAQFLLQSGNRLTGGLVDIIA